MLVLIPIVAGLVNVLMGIWFNQWHSWVVAGFCFGIAFSKIQPK